MTRRRLSLLVLLFFLALALPTSVLVYQAYSQLKWEAFYQHQRLARELTLRIDAGFRNLIEREENRAISDYEFLNVAGSGPSALLQRSPLSELPPESAPPGLVGYFQVDADGRLRTPLLPRSNLGDYGLSIAELGERRLQADRIRVILGENRLVERGEVGAAPEVSRSFADSESDEAAVASEALQSLELSAAADSNLAAGSAAADVDDMSADGRGDAAGSAFDELTSRSAETAPASAELGEQVKDLKLEDRYQVAAEMEAEEAATVLNKEVPERRSRKEKVNLPQAAAEPPAEASSGLAEAKPALSAEPPAGRQAIRIQTFESEVEPMEFALLDSGHFVLFRRVWHQGERYVQGVLIDQAEFIDGLVAPAFRESSLSSMSELIVAWRGAILRQYAADYDRGYRPDSARQSSELLYQSRLVAPFGDIELIYTLARLPLGAGGQVVIWSALVLVVVLAGGCLMILRLGQRQLALARQQQDFVSAVSHELKTPLTSIRMYGEMLREGWADEAKRKTYYDFIFHEAERLTRLINNVLQLARLSRNEQSAETGAVGVAAALAELRPRLESQLEPSGFELDIAGEAEVENLHIRVDLDWFIQIFINLVDNAVKFSANASKRRVDIRYRQTQDGRVQFSVRDYGAGIEADQMKKIFQLFYRPENELTRETIGTGIGLALVQQLAGAMDAEVDVVNSDPGAEFRIRFRVESAG